MKKVMTLMASLMLLVGIAAFAQGTSQKTKSTKETKTKGEVTRQASGTIRSTDTGTLVLTHKVSGKQEEISFVMNDQTKKEGELRSGEKATVHYKVEGGQNMATMVQAKGSTISAATAQHRKH